MPKADHSIRGPFWQLSRLRIHISDMKRRCICCEPYVIAIIVCVDFCCCLVRHRLRHPKGHEATEIGQLSHIIYGSALH